MTRLAILSVLAALVGPVIPSATAVPFQNELVVFAGGREAPGSEEPKAESNPSHLIVVWATWCRDCREKLAKDVPELQRANPGRVWALNADRDEERARRYIKENSVSVPVLRDPSNTFRGRAKIFGVPHWVLARADGKGGWMIVRQGSGFDRQAIEEGMKWK